MTAKKDSKFDNRDPVRDAGRALVDWERLWVRRAEQGLSIIGLSIRMPRFEGDEYFLVIRAENNESRVVAFRSADTLDVLLVSFVRAVRHDTIKFKEDKYEQGNS